MNPFFEDDYEPLAASAAVVIATADSPGDAETLAHERVGDRSLLAELVTRLGGLQLVVVVVREEEDAGLLDGFENVVVVMDPEWEEGAASLRAGLDFVAQANQFEEAFIVQVHTPRLDPGVFEALAVARRDAGAFVAVPKYRYVRGGPVLIGSDLWPHFMGAEGELDLDEHLKAHPQWVTEVRVDFAPPRRIVTHDHLIDVAR